VDGRTLWFEGADVLADPTHAEWLRTTSAQADSDGHLPGLAASECQALLFWRLRELELSLAESARLSEQARRQSLHEQQSWLSRRAQQFGLESRLRHALAKADATLHSFSAVTGTDGALSQLIVEWSEQGQTYRYRSVLDPHLTVVSSGICLSGRDRDFDLTSLVSVMSDESAW
jgi:hypothetical protein